MKIGIMGTGGVGGYLGGRLAYADLDVTFIARGENLRALRETGLQVHSPKGDFAVGPVQTSDGSPLSAAEVGPVDLVLFCVKAYDADSAMQIIRPMIGAETVVLPVLNGIEHIASLQTSLGERHVLGGMAMINAHKGAPGVVHHVADGGQIQLEFGEWAGEVSPRCEEIQATLHYAGLSTAAVPNISERMWWKLAGICGASIMAVMRGDKAAVWAPETAELLRQAVAEGVAVAHSQEIPLSDTLPDDIVKIAENLPPNYKPSLLVDLENGNRLEVEALSGAIAHLGREAGVSTPVNDFIYACLKPYANGAPQ